MNSLESLTLRTTRAVGRLTALQRRAQAATASGIVRDALDELSFVLDGLHAANEKLVEQAKQLETMRHEHDELRRDYLAVLTAMPIACLFTDAVGTIDDANPCASVLLNVGRQHLIGKPLFLFFMSRDSLIQALASGPADDFEQLLVLRPRERKPREVLVRGTRFPDRERWCWFLENSLETPPPPRPRVAARGDRSAGSDRS
jgi:PAS domain-containing protein